ncbi:alpha-ribazole phosphatase [Tindallia magadiensis]|uniref:Alpha-ribazole phosphatase n=1 Tax=Tindallia magadiensis TaxID=69895 RepID=A0A1I3ASI3_9FIRM|nr:histidine phosphatase family protein [Tindallia magadiensis]SFH52930.1 alpha-ribazole phosphatase [Tindallia magadiensis]
MDLIMVRHGETEDNVKQKMSGWTDTPLNLNGIRQAHIVAQRLKNLSVDRVLSSDLNRAVKTAEIIAQHQSEEIPHEKVIGFREMNFGQLEQLSMQEIEQHYNQEYKKIYTEDKYTFPEGENLNTFHKRVIDTLTAYLQRNRKDENMLIVAHSGTIRCMLTHLVIGNIDGHWRFAVDHCGITVIKNVLEYPYIKKLNDTCHFDHQEGQE